MRALLLFAAAFAVFGTTAADHCTTWWTEVPVLTQDPFYVDVWLCQIQCAHTWYSVVYEETNGLDGLQRRDSFEDTTCHGSIPADRLVLEPGG